MGVARVKHEHPEPRGCTRPYHTASRGRWHAEPVAPGGVIMVIRDEPVGELPCGFRPCSYEHETRKAREGFCCKFPPLPCAPPC
jgi:hypothetical protein